MGETCKGIIHRRHLLRHDLISSDWPAPSNPAALLRSEPPFPVTWISNVDRTPQDVIIFHEIRNVHAFALASRPVGKTD